MGNTACRCGSETRGPEPNIELPPDMHSNKGDPARSYRSKPNNVTKNRTDNMKLFIRTAANGTLFRKHKYRRHWDDDARYEPKEVLIKVIFDAENGEPLRITRGTGDRHVEWDTVKLIAWGLHTPTYTAIQQRMNIDPKTCFSVVSTHTIWDVQNDNTQIVEMWVKGLRQLLGQSDEEADRLSDRLRKHPPKAQKITMPVERKTAKKRKAHTVYDLDVSDSEEEEDKDKLITMPVERKTAKKRKPDTVYYLDSSDNKEEEDKDRLIQELRDRNQALRDRNQELRDRNQELKDCKDLVGAVFALLMNSGKPLEQCQKEIEKTFRKQIQWKRMTEANIQESVQDLSFIFDLMIRRVDEGLRTQLMESTSGIQHGSEDEKEKESDEALPNSPALTISPALSISPTLVSDYSEKLKLLTEEEIEKNKTEMRDELERQRAGLDTKKSDLESVQQEKRFLLRAFTDQKAAMESIRRHKERVDKNLVEKRIALASIEKEKENLEKLVQEQKATIESIRKDKEDFERNILEQKGELKGRETILRENIKELKGKFEALTTDNRSLSIRNETLERTVEELEQVRQDIIDVETELESEKAMQLFSSPSIDIDFDANTPPPVRQLQSLIENMKMTESERFELETGKRNVETQLLEGSKIQTLSEEFDLERNELKRANSKLNDEIDALKAKLANEDERAAVMKELIAQKSESLKAAEQKINELNHENAVLKELQSQCSQEISDLETQLAQKSEDLKVAEQNLRELKSRFENQNAKYLELEEKLMASTKALAGREEHTEEEVEEFNQHLIEMEEHHPEFNDQFNQTAELDEHDELIKTSELLDEVSRGLGMAPFTDSTKIDPITDGLSDCSQENASSHTGSPDSSDRVHIINHAPIAKWEVADVSSWLATLGGMDGAIQCFKDELVDGERMLELDHSTLVEIGVSSQSVRNKILSNLRTLVEIGSVPIKI